MKGTPWSAGRILTAQSGGPRLLFGRMYEDPRVELLAFLGLLPLVLAPDLLAGTPLGTALLAGETVFWGLRWVFQFTVFPARLWRGDRWRTAAHVVLALLWTWVAAVFGYALAATP
jgi:hypothetical protein